MLEELPIPDLKLLDIKQIRISQVGDLLYRYEHGQLPLSFTGYFKLRSMMHDHNKRGASLYRPTKARANLRSFSIKSTGPIIWNTVPSEIRTAVNRFDFKKECEHSLLTHETPLSQIEPPLIPSNLGAGSHQRTALVSCS